MIVLNHAEKWRVVSCAVSIGLLSLNEDIVKVLNASWKEFYKTFLNFWNVMVSAEGLKDLGEQPQ